MADEYHAAVDAPEDDVAKDVGGVGAQHLYCPHGRVPGAVVFHHDIEGTAWRRDQMDADRGLGGHHRCGAVDGQERGPAEGGVVTSDGHAKIGDVVGVDADGGDVSNVCEEGWAVFERHRVRGQRDPQLWGTRHGLKRRHGIEECWGRDGVHLKGDLGGGGEDRLVGPVCQPGGQGRDRQRLCQRR